MQPTEPPTATVLATHALGQTGTDLIAGLAHDVAITPDGNEFYFGLISRNYATIAIMKQVDGRWTEPQIAPFSTDPEVFDLEPQGGRASLVGIQENDPRRIDVPERPVLLGARAVVRPLEKPDLVVALGDLGGAIGGERVHDHDVVAPQQRLDAVADVVLFVETGDETAHSRPGASVVEGRHILI